MNEKSKAIVEQARDQANKICNEQSRKAHADPDNFDQKTAVAWPDVFENAMVELIVLECARISDEVDETSTGQGAASAQAFKEHFGVK